MLDLDLDVDRVAIRLVQLKKQRAEVALAELEDREAMAAEDTALQAALRDMEDAENTAAAARTAYQIARGAVKQRAERIKTQRAETARAAAAMASAEKIAEREQTDRLALVPA